MKGICVFNNCDCCGRFAFGVGSSHLFVPDTPFTYEENKSRCPRCTLLHGQISSSQGIDSSKCAYTMSESQGGN